MDIGCLTIMNGTCKASLIRRRVWDDLRRCRQNEVFHKWRLGYNWMSWCANFIGRESTRTRDTWSQVVSVCFVFNNCRQECKVETFTSFYHDYWKETEFTLNRRWLCQSSVKGINGQTFGSNEDWAHENVTYDIVYSLLSPACEIRGLIKLKNTCQPNKVV